MVVLHDMKIDKGHPFYTGDGGAVVVVSPATSQSSSETQRSGKDLTQAEREEDIAWHHRNIRQRYRTKENYERAMAALKDSQESESLTKSKDG